MRKGQIDRQSLHGFRILLPIISMGIWHIGYERGLVTARSQFLQRLYLHGILDSLFDPQVWARKKINNNKVDEHVLTPLVAPNRKVSADYFLVPPKKNISGNCIKVYFSQIHCVTQIKVGHLLTGNNQIMTLSTLLFAFVPPYYIRPFYFFILRRSIPSASHGITTIKCTKISNHILLYILSIKLNTTFCFLVNWCTKLFQDKI